MRKITLLLALVLIVAGCKKDAPLEGTVSDNSLDGKQLLLIAYDEEGIISDTPDTAVVNKKKFSFEGDYLYNGVYYFLTEDESVVGELAEGLPLYISDKGAKVKVEGEKLIIGGNAQNDAYQKLRDEVEASLTDMENLRTEYVRQMEENEGILPPEVENDIMKKDSEIIANQKKIFMDYFSNHLTEALGQEVFLYYEQQGYFSFFTTEELEEMLSNANESFKYNSTVAEILLTIEKEKKLRVGEKFIDFSITDSTGKTVSLSDFAGKGKYVLVDFWASWCGPCLREIPVLKEAYAAYKNKGFEIVSISVDDNEASWRNALKDLNMPWPQLGDGVGSHQPASIYHISTIPHTILLDPQGIIIAKNLRGNAVFNELEKHLE